MIWFFLGLLLLGLTLKYVAPLLITRVGNFPFSKRCAHCAEETRYQINNQYGFINCEYCGLKNFAINPRINPGVIDSLAELDALLPEDHRLFDFFTHTYLVSCLAIAKSDGVISGVERDFILQKLRHFLGGSFNQPLAKQIYETTVRHFSRFSSLELIEFTLIYQVWHALLFIEKSLPKEPAHELIDFLLHSVFETAFADEVLDPREKEVLRIFAKQLGFSEQEFEARLQAAQAYASAKNAHDKFSARQSPGGIPQSVYDFFGVTLQSTRAEIKKAYLNLAKRYHPDKYHNLPAEMQKSAEEKFKEIANQYELLLTRIPH